MNINTLTKLKNACTDTLFLENESMAAHCSFKIGGKCTMAVPENVKALSRLIAACTVEKQDYFILGKGTNILPPDEGMERLVIYIGDGLSGVTVSGNELRAEAGCTLSRAALTARDNGLTGMEFAHGIPGSTGGAVYMNAGAYGGEISGIIISADVMDESGNITTIPAQELALGYRTSRFEKEGRGIITAATFRLSEGNSDDITAKMKELIEKRTASQPLDLPSAGSAFKRPQTGFAAAMIDGAGLKGLCCGGAMVSTKHAGFIVNAGDATAKDVLGLVEMVQEAVKEKYDVLLEPEIRLLKP